MGGHHRSSDVNGSRDRTPPTDGRSQRGRWMYGDAMRFHVSWNPHLLVRRICHQRRSVFAFPAIDERKASNCGKFVCETVLYFGFIPGAESQIVEPCPQACLFKTVLSGNY